MTKQSIKANIDEMDREELINYKEHFEKFVKLNKDDDEMYSKVYLARDLIEYINNKLKEI